MDRNLILKFAKINFETSIFIFLSLSLSLFTSSRRIRLNYNFWNFLN